AGAEVHGHVAEHGGLVRVGRRQVGPVLQVARGLADGGAGAGQRRVGGPRAVRGRRVAGTEADGERGRGGRVAGPRGRVPADRGARVKGARLERGRRVVRGHLQPVHGQGRTAGAEVAHDRAHGAGDRRDVRGDQVAVDEVIDGGRIPVDAEEVRGPEPAAGD